MTFSNRVHQVVCDAIIDLSKPVSSAQVRAGFQPHWRTVFVYECSACRGTHRVFAGAFRGTRPVPGVGGIRCGKPLEVRVNA